LACGNGGRFPLPRKGFRFRAVSQVRFRARIFQAAFVTSFSAGGLSQWAYQGERLGTALLQGDSGIFELAIEVAARPAEKKKNHGKEGGTRGHDKSFSFPTLVDQVIEENEAEDEQTNEADEHPKRHEHGSEDGAFALAGKPFGTMGESGHGAGFPKK
jgi:hypothetical protein